MTDTTKPDASWEAVRAFVAECAGFHGQMVHGNWLSGEAAKVLAIIDERSGGQFGTPVAWTSQRQLHALREPEHMQDAAEMYARPGVANGTDFAGDPYTENFDVPLFVPSPVAAPTSFHFRRFVGGQEMAEDVQIDRAESLDEAIKAAVRICPKRPMTVLVHSPLIPDYAAAQQGEDKRDTKRLDWLDKMNLVLNQHYGTNYRWKMILSPNIVRLTVGVQQRGFVGDVDLNDAQSGENSFTSCREAIDAARASMGDKA